MKKTKDLLESELNKVANFLPPVQLAHIKKHINLYAEEIRRLSTLILAIPKIGENKTLPVQKVYLHYFTGNADYYICEFDGDDTMSGKARLGGFSDEAEYRKFSLSNLKSNRFIELELSSEKRLILQFHSVHVFSMSDGYEEKTAH